jgi:hypothetical protein
VEERLVKPHELSKAILIALSPVIEADERSAWEEYASSTQEWTNEGFVTQDEETRLSKIPHSIHSETSGGLIPLETTGPFSPLWQISPPPSDKSIVNFNLFDNVFVKNLSKHVDRTRNAALSHVINMTELFGTSFSHLGETPESLFVCSRSSRTSAKDAEGCLCCSVRMGSILQEYLHRRSRWDHPGCEGYLP